jgi:flagellar biosynthesis protein FlhA
VKTNVRPETGLIGMFMAAVDQARQSGIFTGLLRNSDLVMPLLVVAILILMILPLPPMMLDILLSFNITFALTVLLVSLYIVRPLDLSTFPSILLLSTLFRLSLNVASTRMILLRGNEGPEAAGNVIKAFGGFVVEGNYVVGAIVFLILVIVNLVVITKGSGRIAEVAARFTLDAMPGKQMSIDADLNAGLIDDQEAKTRRALIGREADFYGAMDGAGKFVKGDAIAGLIITVINIVGGLAIGVIQRGMNFSDAARTYTLLTVGDGLVTQIPALIVATAAGIVVSSAGSETNLGKGISSQIMVQPRAMGLASGVLFSFGLVPGLPTVPFLLLSGLAAVTAYTAGKRKDRDDTRMDPDLQLRGPKSRDADPVESIPPVDLLAIEVGYGLIPFVDVEQNGELLDRIKAVRKQIAREIGIIIPPVHIQDNMQMKPAEYAILLKGNEIARAELMLNHLMAMSPGGSVQAMEGVAAKEPTYGLPALWIKEQKKDQAVTKGYTVVDIPTILITHISEIIRSHAHELLGRQEVQQLVENLRQSHPKVAEELIPGLLSVGGLGRVLQNLLRERVPVRDLLTIMETLADWASVTKDPEVLTEYVRHALARTITRMYMMSDGRMRVLTLDPNLEKTLLNSLQRSEHGAGSLAVDPMVADKMINEIARYGEDFARVNSQPVVLCPVPIRSRLKSLIDRFIPNVAVLSYDDILQNTRIESLGMVKANADKEI